MQAEELLRGTIDFSGYTAELEELTKTGKPGEPVYFTVIVKPSDIPSGFYISTLINVLEAPETPEIIPGYPRVKIVCPGSGDYKFMIRVSLVGKPSCGGVESGTIGEMPAALYIR
ncbi:MAG: hypothetical protein KGY42_03575 [Desulfobacterales bacterium]|nr:hypothetical protein [Desulfobacterales bacterium]MBS3755623.1 hypothetical protein [Desulfobacterales bacterium]